MVTIGVDPHKRSHTAAAVLPGGHEVAGEITVQADQAGYRSLLRWADGFGSDRCWAVENAHGLGQNLAQWLIGCGETVVDVPATATARVRTLSRGHGRKTDGLDAAAAASVAAGRGDASVVGADGEAEVLALLDERRTNLTAERVRIANQLHGLLRDLVAGGAPGRIKADAAARIVDSVEPGNVADTTRKRLAEDLVADLRSVDGRLAANRREIEAAVAVVDTSLTDIVGVGAVVAGRLVGRTGDPDRFPTESHFASYCGVAPVEISSGPQVRHRLSRAGDRQLNSALHTAAIAQIRMVGSEGHTYYQRKITEGKNPKEARRCLKRRIAARVWRMMKADKDRHKRKNEKMTAVA